MGKSQKNTVSQGLSRLLGKRETRNSLIQREIAVNSDIFAKQSNHKYDFFYYGQIDDNTQEWVFHDWIKQGKEWRASTTRYLVKPDRIYRARDGESYREIEGIELQRFHQAVERYYANVYRLYNTA